MARDCNGSHPFLFLFQRGSRADKPGCSIAFCVSVSGVLMNKQDRFCLRQNGLAPTNLHVLDTADALYRAILFYSQDKGCWRLVIIGFLCAVKIDLACGLPFSC